jgi:3-methylcrotonyl-CoA carboxylase alpha subunit
MPKRLQLSTGASDWVAEVSGAKISLTPGDADVTVARSGAHVRVEGLAHPMTGTAIVSGDQVWVTVAGEVFLFSVTHGTPRASDKNKDTRDQDAFTPPMPATVVRILVKPGDAVEEGDVLIALEAMKMELPIRAPRKGVVKAVHCRESELVQPGHVLLELE